jgi:DNA-binding NarL/FixJ family response regulator
MRNQKTVLTPIEQSVLALVARGLTNEEISEQLFFSVNTVKMHLYHIYIKLKARSRAQAFLTAIKLNYIDLHEVFSGPELSEWLSISSDFMEPIVREFRRGLRSTVNTATVKRQRNAARKNIPRQTDRHWRQHKHHILSQELRMSPRRQAPGSKLETLLLKKEERIALGLAARGLTNEEIAMELSLSVSKVKNLLFKTCIKLGARNRIEAILYALKEKAIDFREVYDDNELAMFLSSIELFEIRQASRLIQKELSPSFKSNREPQVVKEAAG